MNELIVARSCSPRVAGTHATAPNELAEPDGSGGTTAATPAQFPRLTSQRRPPRPSVAHEDLPEPERHPLNGKTERDSSAQHGRAVAFDYEQLDPGIVLAVRVLREAGVDTLWSCEGGDGHAYKSPTVVFRGDPAEARRVVDISRRNHLAPRRVLREWRLWRSYDDKRTGPIAEAIGTDGLVGKWLVEFATKFPTRHKTESRRPQGQREAPTREEHRHEGESQAFQQILRLEPAVLRLYEQVLAGVIGMDDVWLTYFSSCVEWFIGPNRQHEGDHVLFTQDALDTVIVALHDRQMAIEAVREGKDHHSADATCVPGRAADSEAPSTRRSSDASAKRGAS